MTSPTSSRTQFIWPPRPGAMGASAVAASEGRAIRDGAAASPREGEASSPASSGVAEAWSFREAMLDIERTWLGLERAPLADQIRESGWRAESESSCCARCGTTAGGEETLDPFEVSSAEAGCRRCRGRTLGWERLIRLGEYDGLIRDAVLETKFRRVRGVGRALGVEMGLALRRAIDRSPVRFDEVVLVPSPISLRRRFWRGIDHSQAIAEGVRAASGVPIRRWLARSHRSPQSTLSEAQRRGNLVGAMRLSRAGRRRAAATVATRSLVVLVDDVMTTGATLREACRVLKRDVGVGVEVWCLVAGVTA